MAFSPFGADNDTVTGWGASTFKYKCGRFKSAKIHSGEYRLTRTIEAKGKYLGSA